VDTDLETGLRNVLRRVWDDPSADLSSLARLTGGASSETWTFDAHRGRGATERLVLRRDPPSLSRPGGIVREAAAIRAAARAGVPEPEVLDVEDDPAVLGSPFLLMSYVPGETIARRILREDEFAGVRPRLASQCGEILARIHALDPGEIPGLAPIDPLATIRDGLAAFGGAHPVLELGLRWLEANRPDPVPPAVVHGDFRNGNLIIGPDGVRAVLDWEIAHLGDPREDLGWLCVRCWRFGAPGPVGGFGSYEQLFDAYERTSGTPVDRHAVRWWEVRGTIWWAVGCMSMAERHLSGAIRSVEYATIGRRVSEQEYDAMLLLADERERSRHGAA
jgi:aminoglycoside phosphotransferase (APT) family kinase protein